MIVVSNTRISVTAVYRRAIVYATDMEIKLEKVHGLNLEPVNGRWFRPPSGYF